MTQNSETALQPLPALQVDHQMQFADYGLPAGKQKDTMIWILTMEYIAGGWGWGPGGWGVYFKK